MKLECTQENLNAGLNLTSRLVSTRASLPVLSNVLLKTEKGRLKLSATDLEIGINAWTGAKIEKNGAITIPARILSDFIATNTDKTIKLSLGDKTLNLKSEHFQAEIKGIEAAEFPLIPQIKNPTTISLSASLLAEAINQVVLATAIDETRPVLTGVLFKGEGKSLKLVATDSYRLAEKEIILNKEVKPFAIIIPNRAVSEVGRAIAGSTEEIVINFGENQAQFCLPDIEITSRLIEGAFPDYEQIIPKQFKTECIMSRQELANAIRMASFFARDTANNIKISVSKKGVEVKAVSPQVGENTSQVMADVSGPEQEIAFNARFILDVLAVLSAPKVSLKIGQALSPGKIQPENDKKYLYIIMPLKIEE